VQNETRAAASSSSNATIVEPRENNFYAYLKNIRVGQPSKSDLEVYLEEGFFMVDDDGPFDVLKWWSQNYIKFPILSKLVRDILCISITIVASELAFSAGGRILDDYRNSFMKVMAEILICGGDWIKKALKIIIQTLQARFNFQTLFIYIVN
jgi:hAT family C-terminal dimerisation region